MKLSHYQSSHLVDITRTAGYIRLRWLREFEIVHGESADLDGKDSNTKQYPTKRKGPKMLSLFPGVLLHIAAIVYLVVVIYVLVLVSRLVRAVERIADKITSSDHRQV